MKNIYITISILVTLVFVGIVYMVMINENRTAVKAGVLHVGIAPYQDMALLINDQSQNLEEKYNVDLDLVTLAWSDLTPAVSSATDTLDIAFAGLTEFLTNERNINRNTNNPLVFIYPAYVFLGGSFVSFNPEMPVLDSENISDVETLKEFLSYSFAAQKSSLYEIMLFSAAKRAGIDFADINLFNIDSADGFLAAINGDIDASSAGLTQRNEALEQGGTVVLNMTDLGLVEIAGFVVKQSVLDEKRDAIEAFIKIWYESVDYVMSDLDINSSESIAYLNSQSSTNYTTKSFKNALSQEFFPKSIAEVQSTILEEGSRFDFKRIQNNIVTYLRGNNIIDEVPQNIELLNID